MRFEAYNLKDTFKIWKISLIAFLVIATLFGVFYLTIEAPKALKPSIDPFLGYVNPLLSDGGQLGSILSIAILIPIVDVALLVFIVVFSKWEKDAKRFAFTIDGSNVSILCENRRVVLAVNTIERFEVLPKNCEPTVFRSKWTGVSIIVANGVAYKLYYLKNMEQARQLFLNTKAYANNT